MLNDSGFRGRVIFLGYGTVAKCALPMMLKVSGLPVDRFTVIDMVDRTAQLADLIAEGLTFAEGKIARDSIGAVLADHAVAGDIVVNLTVGVDSVPVMDWCHHNGIRYVDTALEIWDDQIGNADVPMAERTEYASHQQARRQAKDGWQADGPTAIVTHGANPGMVNHFARQAMLDLAAHVGHDHESPQSRDDWARLARDLRIRVIHISERDTQVAHKPKQVGEFVNTWSIEGFCEEAMMPSELGWGTHEKSLPERAHGHNAGPGNAIFIARPAAEIMLRSWVPKGGQIAGYLLPHGESVTLSDYFTLREGGEVYRPTVAFAYMPCDAAMSSLHELMMQGWTAPEQQRILGDDIDAGMDELGILLLGDGPTGWWYGSQLDIHEARRLIPGTNATAVQVAAGAVSATVWACLHPNRGYCEPEDLPHDEILAIALPWLGPMASVPTDWTPLKQRAGLFDEPELDTGDPWQFVNFRI
ncbi:MAG: saccharopine dehydrogenase NADP-binding domain-containing protein [Rhodospirillales bacterium]|nr:saccharopine dehydrogenase NADP-binding domain-containing protein [Rhodospirillales bacterium]